MKPLSRSAWVGFGIVLMIVSTSTGVWSDGPVAAVTPIAEDGTLQISMTDRCPVCGMFPAKRSRSAAGLTLVDGRSFYFCSNGCLLRTYRHPSAYLGAAAPAIQRMVVQDYLRGTPIDAGKAWWVAGSDVVGPMGPALVALGYPQDVATFNKRHGGKEVFQIGQIDDALWERLFEHRKK